MAGNILRENTFNGGRLQDGLLITAKNSGGGNGHAFTGTGGNNVVQYTTQFCHSPPGAAIFRNATIQDDVRWGSLGSLTTPIFFRLYLYLERFPATNPARVGFFLDGGAAFMGGIPEIQTDGTIRGRIAAGGATAIGVVPVALNRMIRIEGMVVGSTTAGVLAWRLYNDADSSEITEQKIGTGLVLGANVNEMRFGLLSGAIPALPFTMGIDDLAIGDTDWLGAKSIFESDPAYQ